MCCTMSSQWMTACVAHHLGAARRLRTQGRDDDDGELQVVARNRRGDGARAAAAAVGDEDARALALPDSRPDYQRFKRPSHMSAAWRPTP